MDDLLTVDDLTLGFHWETRPIRDDEDNPHSSHPEYLDDGSPRYVAVTFSLPDGGGRFMVADALSPPGVRDYFIGEVIQDELCDWLRDRRPL
jgi:hypothetical protein